MRHCLEFRRTIVTLCCCTSTSQKSVGSKAWGLLCLMVCHDPVVYGIICEYLLLSHIVLVLLQQPFWQCIIKLHTCI